VSQPFAIVNIRAVVLSFTQPFLTKNGDLSMSIALIDPSLPLYENQPVEPNTQFINSVTINIFVRLKDQEPLPQVRFAGDVIRLNNVRLSQWNQELQLLGNRYVKSKYIVFRDDSDDNCLSTMTTVAVSEEDNFNVSEEEEMELLDLWEWGQKRLRTYSTMKSVYSFKISDLMPQDDRGSEQRHQGDLTVMVAAVFEVPLEIQSCVRPRGFLRVWDGTGPPQSDNLPLNSENALRATKNGDPPTEALVKIAKIVRKLEVFRENPDLQPPTKLTGRVVNVAIWEKQHWDLVVAGAIYVGCFVRLRNVKDEIFKESDMRALSVHEKSSLTPLPNMTFEVLRLLEEHNNRLLRKEHFNPNSGILPLESDGGSNKIDSQISAIVSATVIQPAPATEIQPSIVQTQHARNSQSCRESHRHQEIMNEETVHHQQALGAPPGIPLVPLLYCTSLQDLKIRPVGTIFQGLVRITYLIPSLSCLSSEGFQQICPKASNGSRYYRFGICLEGGSPPTSVDAVISDNDLIKKSIPPFGPVVFGMSATESLEKQTGALYNASNFLKESSLYKTAIESFAFQGHKYFALLSVSDS
jgi:Telomeric single stranded DNA binding POT1/CDC13